MGPLYLPTNFEKIDHSWIGFFYNIVSWIRLANKSRDLIFVVKKNSGRNGLSKEFTLGIQGNTLW